MRDAEHHILFIATEYAAGMRPYASAMVHTLWQAGDRLLVVAKGEEVKHDFDDLPANQVTWIDYPTSKLGKLAFRVWPSRLVGMIEQLVTDYGIQLIYCLTGELILANHIRRLQRHAPLLYTIHDAVGHDSKFEGWTTWLKHKFLINGPQQRMINNTKCQITNSEEQQRLVKERYPYHRVYYAPFPTLVTPDITNGNATVPELEAVDDGYILFFGNLQLYKGVHLLYEAYLSHPEFHNRALVIAGAGYVYFKLRDDENGRVIFINRYVDDKELKDLFSRAALVVYPYVSATQSGVMSIASYFGKPMVVSDLPFFKQIGGTYQGIEFFATGDSEDLALAMIRSLQSPETDTRGLYQHQYAPQALSSALEDILKVL